MLCYFITPNVFSYQGRVKECSNMFDRTDAPTLYWPHTWCKKLWGQSCLL